MRESTGTADAGDHCKHYPADCHEKQHVAVQVLKKRYDGSVDRFRSEQKMWLIFSQPPTGLKGVLERGQW